jgi:NADH dehydrogenase [ubiquinone] 1 alpha subcomplex assembly factor 1
MFRERVRSVGIAIMDQQEGPFELEVESIKAVNDDDTFGDRPRMF